LQLLDKLIGLGLMKDEPNIGAPTPWGTSSEAAGAYQFMKPTWDGAKQALGLPDFSPESQEKAGRYLTKGRGVNPDQLFKLKKSLEELWINLHPNGLDYLTLVLVLVVMAKVVLTTVKVVKT
jgi:hypothetical protein